MVKNLSTGEKRGLFIKLQLKGGYGRSRVFDAVYVVIPFIYLGQWVGPVRGSCKIRRVDIGCRTILRSV
jgi:hypothetical protein